MFGSFSRAMRGASAPGRGVGAWLWCECRAPPARIAPMPRPVANAVSSGGVALRNQVALDAGEDDLCGQGADEQAHQAADDLQALLAEQSLELVGQVQHRADG